MEPTELNVVEIWKDALDWEGYYQVSNKGRVRSIPRIVERVRHGIIRFVHRNGKVITQSPNVSGYMRVRLCRKGTYKHVKVANLVLRTFVGLKPDGKECRHLDGCKENNFLTNLCYGTHSENELDKIRQGCERPRGSKGRCFNERT